MQASLGQRPAGRYRAAHALLAQLALRAERDQCPGRVIQVGVLQRLLRGAKRGAVERTGHGWEPPGAGRAGNPKTGGR